MNESAKVRVNLTGAATTGIQSTTGFSDAARVIPTGSTSGLIHGAGIGYSRAVRMVSSCGCVDDFTRTVASGWGSSPSFISAWTTGATGDPGTPEIYWGTANFSVTGLSEKFGQVDIGWTGDSRTTALAYADLSGGSYPGRLLLKVRRQGLGGAYVGPDPHDTGLHVAGYIRTSTAYDWTDVCGFDLVYRPADSRFILSVTDARSGPSGTEYNESIAYVDGIDWDGIFEWWNVDLYVDHFGTYCRIWTDYSYTLDGPESPTAHPNASQPPAGMGADQTWTAWYAHSVAASPDVTPARMWIESTTPWALGHVGSAYYGFDMVTTCGGLCTA